ncbi:unnamed protein product [Thlaspi arvense]|uniref:S-protein homolog n=1 Tax=Thlaspi arvense TaxID=13288 RepID=A0AAU9RJ84_THLAR|nr:unnamed protein product [Thlaspi arvense]
MRGEDSFANKAIVWCLVLQVIIFQGNSIEVGDVSFTLMMKNEMFGLHRPLVVYRCKSSEKSLRWHESYPKSEFTWDFEVPPFGTGLVIHRCQFLSSQGTADVEIETLSMTSTLCGGHLCKYVIRPNATSYRLTTTTTKVFRREVEEISCSRRRCELEEEEELSKMDRSELEEENKSE